MRRKRLTPSSSCSTLIRLTTMPATLRLADSGAGSIKKLPTVKHEWEWEKAQRKH